MHSNTMFRAFAVACVLTTAVWAEVKLPTVLSDHMVLQQELPVPIWGTAAPDEEITVTLGDQKETATADKDGRWRVKLKPLKASGDAVELTVAGKNTITLKDILIGEVWVCSGQSNMEFQVRSANNADEEIKNADFPNIRLFSVPKNAVAEPQSDTQGNWSACNPKSAPTFSAVGYYFGRHLHKKLEVPIGLIHTSWGGTPAESWTSQSAVESDPDFKPMLDRWKQKVDENAKQGQKSDSKSKVEAWRPAALFNGMISPLVPFAIRGAIWYQGESNAPRAYQYRKLLPAMIKSWRDVWHQGDFPFLIVSLANFQPVKDEPGDSTWAELREAQSMTAAQPHNGQALAIDVGDAKDIHPKDKQTVGYRLALQALSMTYGKDIIGSGPVYSGMVVRGDAVLLKFKHAEGLKAKGDKLKGFAIAGEDKKWYWADAIIDEQIVKVHSDKVAEPKAVRYAWADNPVCNLYNKADLPAVPFRTDDWKGVTADAK